MKIELTDEELDKVYKLRNKTNAGIMTARKALEQCHWNEEEALKLIKIWAERDHQGYYKNENQ